MGESSDEAAIRAQIEAWAAAVRRQDMAGILRNHAADMIMFDVPPPLQLRGIAPYEGSWPQFFDASPRPIKFDIVDLTITAGQDVAALRHDGRRQCRSRFSPDDRTAQDQGTVDRDPRAPLRSRNVLIC
jgi:ketosteroid isomerase-like protein